MEYHLETQDSCCTIYFKGRFTFVDHQTFKPLFHLLNPDPPQRLRLDFSATEYVDSAAMGMVLLLRDEAKKHGTTVSIQNPNAQLQKLLELTRINELF